MLTNIIVCLTALVVVHVYATSQCIGPCIFSKCQTGYTCTNRQCCPISSRSTQPPSQPCVALGPYVGGCPSNSTDVNGQCCALCQALGPCINNQCQSGAVCYNGECRQYCTGAASTCVGPCINEACDYQYVCTNEQCCQ